MPTTNDDNHHCRGDDSVPAQAVTSTPVSASASSGAPPGDLPATWISVAETAALLHLKPSTVIQRISKGSICGKLSEDVPMTWDGKPNYIIRLEALPQKAQYLYQIAKLPINEFCSADLTSSRALDEELWKLHITSKTEVIRQAMDIQKNHRSTGNVTKLLQKLASDHQMSLSGLYRLLGHPASKEVSLLYLDPAYMQEHIPKTMCLWSVDLCFALHLDEHSFYSENEIFRILNTKRDSVPCKDCPYAPGQQENQIPYYGDIPTCHKASGYMVVPNNRRTVNRLLAHIPPSAVCLQKEGFRKWRSDYGYFTERDIPMLSFDTWIGDHHVFDIFVRVVINRERNDINYNKEIIIRPVLTAWMDCATGCVVGWTISVLPNSDTIAEAFCRASVYTVGEPFHGLPRRILVDCGKDYSSMLLEDMSQELSGSLDSDSNGQVCLNRRFSGFGLFPALGVEVHHALPYHPQSKAIERMFGTLESEWISKLPGWCHNCVADRPQGFGRHLQDLIQDKKLLTMEEFVMRFQAEILPGYHSFRETQQDDTLPGWEVAFKSMSPMQRYHTLEKARTVTPDWKTISILKQHITRGCKVQHYGIKFLKKFYRADELAFYEKQTVDILHYRITPNYVPSSITVIANGRYLCEAFLEKAPDYLDAPASELQAKADAQNAPAKAIKKQVARIKRSTEGLLPRSADSSPTEKEILQDECYAPPLDESKNNMAKTTVPDSETIVDVKKAALELPEGVDAPTDSPDIDPKTRTTEPKSSPADMRSVMELLFGSIMD